MEFQFDQEWTLHPIEGDTGQAFMGIHKQEKIFLKRNSSPFLAALSMEGITPRLIWTKWRCFFRSRMVIWTYFIASRNSRRNCGEIITSLSDLSELVQHAR